MFRLLLLLPLALLVSCETGEPAVPAPNPGPLPQDAFNEMLVLTDTSTLAEFADFNARMDRIQSIFADYADPRGAFATLYEATTRASADGFEEGIYENDDYTHAMVIDFSKRYLYALHDHLLGLPSEFHWQVYFDHAASGKSITRLLLDGINAHITIDLARSLAHTGAYPEFEDDFVLIGDNITPAVPEFLEVLQADYGVDAEALFNVFFVGDIFDAIFGEGATVNFGFNLIRMEAFESGLILQVPDRAHDMQRGLEYRFEEKARLIALIDALGLLP